MMHTLALPEAIMLKSKPPVRNVARPVLKAIHNWLFRKMYSWQVGRFFCACDSYLSVGVARRFHELFPNSVLCLLPGAYHYVQIDEPEQVAHLLLSTPRAA